MAFKVEEVKDKDAWEKFILSIDDANFLQSWYWGDTNEAIGKKVFRLGYINESNILSGAMIAVLEEAKRGRYIAVSAGPILSDWENKELIRTWLGSLRQLARDNDCVFVRVRPQLISSDASKLTFKQLGFRSAPMHLEAELTSQLDLTQNIDRLLLSFRKNTRRGIKQAKKKGIKITSTKDAAAIEEFYDLQLDTAKRHGFVPFSKIRLESQFDAFSNSDHALLYSAHSADNELISQAVIVFYGSEASYHYGASSEIGRKEPGAYLLQWHAIQEAIKRGCTRYNFWGVVKEEETSHRFYGVSVFKRGFRGQDVEYLHAQDLVFNKLKYLINFTIESLRKRARKL